MNIFFNSRINANQSLLNVLFGQQQKATSSQRGNLFRKTVFQMVIQRSVRIFSKIIS